MTNIDGTNISKCETVAQLKKYSKTDFSSFWQDLGCGGSFFLVRIQLKKVFWKLFFPAFGTILVLVAACFYSKFNLKKYLKTDFSSFWYDLGFGGSFFPVRIQLKKYEKIDFLTFWHDLGSGGSFFLFNI